jgi:3-hydroxyisobutyrate dehydrogenase-like beta-hydroxyacid dehydrogenase
MDVGFIGLGLMGVGMARNLAKAGHAVKAWNRSPVSDEHGAGLTIVGSAAEAFDADVVFTMLSDDAAIQAVVLDNDLLAAARPGAVHVVAATISVAFAGVLAERHAQAGVAYVSAPVFGRPDAAAAAQLNIVAAGDPAAIAKAQPLLDVVGRKTWVLGQTPGSANAAKIAGNMMIAMALEAMGEAAVITETHGVDPAAFFEIMAETLFGARAYTNYMPKIVSGDFEPGFKMKLGLKDLRLAEAARAPSGLTLPMLDAVRGQMTAAVEAGLGDRDWSAVTGFTRDTTSRS